MLGHSFGGDSSAAFSHALSEMLSATVDHAAQSGGLRRAWDETEGENLARAVERAATAPGPVGAASLPRHPAGHGGSVCNPRCTPVKVTVPLIIPLIIPLIVPRIRPTTKLASAESQR